MTGRAISMLAAVGVLASLIGFGGAAEAQPNQTAVAAAAPVLTGVEKRQSTINEISSRSPKSAVAKCPAGKKVVGGGGWTMEETSTAPDRLTLTQLEPKDDVDGLGTDGYIASAAETSPGVSGNWWVQAYVFCADAISVSGWHINADFTDTTSDPRQQMAVGCDNPATQRVIGTGARIAVSAGFEGQVVLQVARASGPGDITRAQSHEDADGYTGTHWLGAYAICMNTPQGYSVATGESTERLSETHKIAFAGCGGKQLLSAGAAITDVAPGNVSLQVVFPGSNVEAFAVENTPTSLNWDFIIARGICVDKP